MVKENKIHADILKEALTNLEKHTTINSISTATNYNWRTVKMHIQEIANQFKQTYNVIEDTVKNDE